MFHKLQLVVIWQSAQVGPNFRNGGLDDKLKLMGHFRRLRALI
jgi:hypothetical protein